MNLYGCIKLTFTNIQEHSHLRVCMYVFYLLHGWCASLSEQKSDYLIVILTIATAIPLIW